MSTVAELRIELLEGLIKDLVGALDRQCFPNGSGRDQPCRYSASVETAMDSARRAVADNSLAKADPADLTRPIAPQP